MKKMLTALALAILMFQPALADELTDSISLLTHAELESSIDENTDPWAAFMLGQSVSVASAIDGKAAVSVCAWNPENLAGDGEATMAEISNSVKSSQVAGEVSYATDDKGILQVTGVDAFRKRIVSAASQAKSAFNSAQMRVAISDVLIPEVYGGNGGYTNEFKTLEEGYWGLFPSYVIEAAAITQQPTVLSVDTGPNAMSLGVNRVNSSAMARTAYLNAYSGLKNIDKANSYTREELSDILAVRFTQAAVSSKNEDYNTKGELVVDIQRLINGDYINQSFIDYMAAINKSFEEKLDTLEIAVRYLPDYPARNQPDSGVISGPISGTHVLFKSADDGFGRIVRLVKPRTGETALSLFMRSGDSVDAYIPFGKYGLYYAKGVEWYGMIKQFGPDAVYASSIVDIEVLQSDSYHVISLGADDRTDPASVRIPMKSDGYVEP